MGVADIPRLMRAVADPLALGDESAETMDYGHMLALGDDWPISVKTLVLRRRSLYPTPSRWAIVGMEDEAATVIASWDAYAHAVSQAYEYAVAVALGNGYISGWSEPIRVEFTSGGTFISDMPNAPYGVDAVPIDGGQFTVGWQYDTWGQGADPASFEVYSGDDATMTYTPPGIAQVTYDATVRRYEVTPVTTWNEGDLVRFAVRSKSASSNIDQNTDTTGVKIARADGPVDAAEIRLAYPRRT